MTLGLTLAIGLTLGLALAPAGSADLTARKWRLDTGYVVDEWKAVGSGMGQGLPMWQAWGWDRGLYMLYMMYRSDTTMRLD